MSSLSGVSGASRIMLTFKTADRNAATTVRTEWGWGQDSASGLPIDDFTLIVERMYYFYETGSYTGGALTTTVSLYKSGTTDLIFDALVGTTSTLDDGNVVRIGSDTSDYANGEAGATLTSGATLVVRVDYQTASGTCRVLDGWGVLVCRSVGNA